MTPLPLQSPVPHSASRKVNCTLATLPSNQLLNSSLSQLPSPSTSNVSMEVPDFRMTSSAYLG